MLKWQVSPPSESSGRSYTTDTSCASDSDATITPDRCRRFDIRRKADHRFSNRFSFDPELLNRHKFKQTNHRLSYESSELTNITDLGNFSDLEKISDAEPFDEVFRREDLLTPTYFDNKRLHSPASSTLTIMEERDIYETLNGAFWEVKNWMSVSYCSCYLLLNHCLL